MFTLQQMLFIAILSLHYWDELKSKGHNVLELPLVNLSGRKEMPSARKNLDGDNYILHFSRVYDKIMLITPSQNIFPCPSFACKCFSPHSSTTCPILLFLDVLFPPLVFHSLQCTNFLLKSFLSAYCALGGSHCLFCQGAAKSVNAWLWALVMEKKHVFLG